jgi:N,N'-diacetylchitobiose transport system permease protein
VRNRPARIVADVVAALLCLVLAFPIYWMVNTSFKKSGDIKTPKPKFLPLHGTFQHYLDAVHKPGFTTMLSNSLIVTTSSVVLGIAAAFLAAVAVARFRFAGRKTYLVMLLIAQMIPLEAMVIPVYLMFRPLNLVNNLVGLIAWYMVFVMPFAVLTLRSFIQNIPASLEEAAMVDGCGRARAFWRVTFPLVAPGLATTAIYGFIQAWSEFIFALTLMHQQDKQTLPVWLVSFNNRYTGLDWGAWMAASTLFTLPALVLFLFVQRKVTTGLVAGGVKG